MGLAKDSLDPADVHAGFVDELSAAMRGSPDSAAAQPALEGEVAKALEAIERRSLEEMGWFVRKARWPGNAPFGVCLTHDVDNVSRPLGHLLRRAGRFGTTDLLLALVGLRSVYNNIDHIAEIERKRGYRSSFYFLSKNYDLDKLSRTAKGLDGAGWEVGLHGDFGTHDSPQAMAEASARLESAFGRKPRGAREHYLQFDYAKTWGILQSSGFLYDTTVGNRDRIGFRLGLCTPFHPPDPSWEPIPLLELPLALMDTTLWGYLRKTEDEGEKVFVGLLDAVGEVNGLMTLLWHQESVRMKGGRIYPRLLDTLAGRGCYVADGETVARWWLERGAPLAVAGAGVTMDAAPAGMALTFKTTGEKAPVVEGGVLVDSPSGTTVHAAGGPLRLRFD